MTEDYCSYFPDFWFKWVGPFKWEMVYIGDICKNHDDTCSSTTFYTELWERRVVGTYIIGFAGALGCWVKYTSKMFKRV